jgi:hypothetical protein
VPTIEKFPKSHKFTIGDRIEITALDVLDALMEATYTLTHAPPTPPGTPPWPRRGLSANPAARDRAMATAQARLRKALVGVAAARRAQRSSPACLEASDAPRA